MSDDKINAGKYPQRGRLPHAVPAWVNEGSFFFITICCDQRNVNNLCCVGVGDKLLKGAEHYHQTLSWYCRLMLLMPDHLHAVIAFPCEPGLKTVVTNWKRYQARQLGVDWQRDFFDHRLRDHHEQIQKIDYIMKNPVRRNLCERAEDWPWIYRPNDRLPPTR